MKPSITDKTERLWGLFPQHTLHEGSPLHRIQFCFTIYVVEFVNHISLVVTAFSLCIAQNTLCSSGIADATVDDV
jgi:hypothetical protein